MKKVILGTENSSPSPNFKLKEKLAKRFPKNRKEYTKLKADFIERIIDKAKKDICRIIEVG